MMFMYDFFNCEGIKAIIYSIIAAIICLVFVPQNIRDNIKEKIKINRNSIKYVIVSRFEDENKAKIIVCKGNNKIFNKFFREKITEVHIRIYDLRKLKIRKNLRKMFPYNYEIKNKNVLEKIKKQKEQFKKATNFLFADKSIINSDVYRKRYSYNKLIKVILLYNISDEVRKRIKIRLVYYKNKRNKLPCDIAIPIYVDEKFLRKYSKQIKELYFDYAEICKNINLYKEKFENWSDDEIVNYLEFSKRNNMDIYDLEIEDYIQYIAPQFYTNISIIAEGEWVYSKLDINQYKIDNFRFDLEQLSELVNNSFI